MDRIVSDIHLLLSPATSGAVHIEGDLSGGESSRSVDNDQLVLVAAYLTLSYNVLKTLCETILFFQPFS